MTDQDNAGSTESDYRKNGCSERSLEMLESEEGQLESTQSLHATDLRLSTASYSRTP